jgi:PEP-CTERM motif
MRTQLIASNFGSSEVTGHGGSLAVSSGPERSPLVYQSDFLGNDRFGGGQMSNELISVDAPSAPTPKVSKRSSKAAKLVQAAALAAVLIPLGSVAVETSTINCSSSYSGCIGTFSPTNTSNDYDFGAFDYILTMLNVNGTFDVDIAAQFGTQGSFALQMANFPGYQCVDLMDPSSTGAPCVDFGIFAPDPGPNSWQNYRVKIAWDFDSNSLFPGDRITILHDFGDRQRPGDFDNIYDEDMCLNPLNTACTYFPGPGDPSISSGDTDFQHMLVALRPAADAVPEPATLIMLGSGISAFLYRRRRRSRDPENPQL